MNYMITCNSATLNKTLHILREGGGRNCETVVLWLGTEIESGYRVSEVFRPQQEVGVAIFRIPSTSMRELMGHLRNRRMRIIAQVHSHPEKAFHSKADDEWAIVRHAGAISIVVPYFARDVDDNNFASKVAAFQLSTDDKWIAVDFRSVVRVVHDDCA